MARIDKIDGYWVLDSRGNPTVQVGIVMSDGSNSVSAKGASPSGASTGSHEAVELRDGREEFHGKGVSEAIENVNKIIKNLLEGNEFEAPGEIDKIMIDLDGTDNKSNLGANAILAVSIAIHKAFAHLAGEPLFKYFRKQYFEEVTGWSMPRLMSNIINGGEHADNDLSIQEFMIVPKLGELRSDVQAASEIYHTLKKNLNEQELSTSLGDEGGFAPNINSAEDVLDLIQDSINKSGYQDNIDLALDCAANEYFEDGEYNYQGSVTSGQKPNQEYQSLVEKYNIVSIEDGFAEDDYDSWKQHTDILGDKAMLVGDDLFVTNVNRFNDIGLEKGIGNAVLIKMNQIGTVSETIEMIKHAHKNNYKTIISHRSGETTDPLMSDLCVAAGSEFIKLGAPARGERVAKYNRLIEIDQIA